MHEAIDLLARSGRNDLASDLNRIIAKIDFDDLEVLRCPGSDRIADAILEAGSFTQLGGLLGRIAAVMGLDHCTLHVISEAPASNFATKVLTTYPDLWVARYVDRRYATIDPVSRACVAADHGFFWDSLQRSAPVLRTFWDNSAAHGVGPSGYTVPIVTERGDKLALSVCSRIDLEAFRDRVERLESDLFSLGIFLVDAFCRLACDDRPASFNPSDDQLSILRAIAMGADEADLRSRSYQYGSYVTLERSICSLFRTQHRRPGGSPRRANWASRGCAAHQSRHSGHFSEGGDDSGRSRREGAAASPCAHAQSHRRRVARTQWHARPARLKETAFLLGEPRCCRSPLSSRSWWRW